ncbi:MAG TPA: 2-dehydropantoate 2-reductase [Actinomycetota bacterium]|nr:2-dehydropantoate 2-reductase [Actinomycetota bacterium]
MRIAVFGVGGVGGYVGARLAEAGEDVVLIARGAHLRAIREHGLHLESIAGDAHVRPSLATDDPAEAGNVDSVIAATKTWQLPDAARTMGPLIGADTTVVPLLNGVEAADVLAEALGPEPVVGGLCGMISFLAGPGRVRHTGAEPWVTIGELDGKVTDRVRSIEAALSRCRGLKVALSDRIRVELWEKLAFITATGGVGAVTRAPIGAFRDVPETRALLEAAMREVVEVARARGVPVGDHVVAERMSFVDRLEAHGTASMQRDIMAGRRSELDELNGAVVRLGREAGVDTPVHSAIYAALRPQELRALGELAFAEPPAGPS